MSIRTRTSIYVTLTMLVLTLAFMLLGTTRVDRGFSELQRRDAEKSVSLVTSWLASQAEPAQRSAQSYADWAPTFRFVTKGDKDYVEKNMTQADFASTNADFMIFLNKKREVVYAKFIRYGGARDDIVAAVLEDPGFTKFTDLMGGRSTLLGSTHGPVALGLAPIVVPNTPERGIGGTLITGRFLDDTMMTSLTDQTGLSSTGTAWFSPRQPDLPADATAAADQLRTSGKAVVVEKTGANAVTGYGVLKGLMDRPAAIVKITVDPTITSVRNALLRDTGISLLIFIIVSITALVIALDTSILRRLSHLIGGVRRIGEADEKSGARVAVMGHDEIAELATSVNGMLEAIDKQRDQLVKLATVDALTNVCNRRRFVEELRRELGKAKRLGDSGALLWIDVDNFKEINDTYGHATGDHVLVAIAKLLGSEMRAYCTLARLGGDEFVMMIPGADREQGRLAAERLLDRFKENHLEVDGLEINIGVSIGVAFYPEHGDTAKELLEAADNAMYDSKRDGRCRVTVSLPPTHETSDHDKPQPPRTAPGAAEPAMS